MSVHKSLESVSHQAPANTLGIEDTFLATSFQSLNLSRTKFSPSPKQVSLLSSSGSDNEVECEGPQNCCTGKHLDTPRREKK